MSYSIAEFSMEAGICSGLQNPWERTVWGDTEVGAMKPSRLPGVREKSWAAERIQDFLVGPPPLLVTVNESMVHGKQVGQLGPRLIPHGRRVTASMGSPHIKECIHSFVERKVNNQNLIQKCELRWMSYETFIIYSCKANMWENNWIYPLKYPYKV